MRKLLLAVMLVVFGASLLVGQESTAWGKTDKGLRMSLAVDNESHELIFAIQNVSGSGEDLDLGENGIPYGFTVSLTTRDGKFWNSLRIPYPASGGGVWTNVIEMMPNSTYVIRHAMKDFADPSGDSRTFAHPLPALRPGDFLTAHYASKDERCFASDCRGQIHCWTGDLTSNIISIK